MIKSATIFRALLLLSPGHLVTWSPGHLQAAEMKDELLIDITNLTRMRTLFDSYGYRPNRSLVINASGLRMRLPENVPDIPQTGLYSKFAVTGDIEVSFIYELLSVPPPTGGYGCGVGLAFDNDRIGRGSIQRMIKSAKESVYVLQTSPTAAGAKQMKEEGRQVDTTAKRGRLGLRRVKKELVFLAANDSAGELEEIGRLPFTDQPIRPIRIYVDAGGSPTTVDVRVRDLQVRSDEVAGGESHRPEAVAGWQYLWILAVGASLGLLLWRWRVYRRQSREEEADEIKPRFRKP